jgi:hypothetical protein
VIKGIEKWPQKFALPIARKFTIFVVEVYFWHAIFLDYFSIKLTPNGDLMGYIFR